LILIGVDPAIAEGAFTFNVLGVPSLLMLGLAD